MMFPDVDKTINKNRVDTIDDVLYHKSRNLNGIFIGEVVDTNDTEKRGRIKVKIYSITSDTESNLPWAIPLLLTGHSLTTPEVGDKVGIMFINGSIFSPAYIGVFLKENTYSSLSPNNSEDIIYENKDSSGTENILRKQQKIEINASSEIDLKVGNNETIKMTSSATEISHTGQILQNVVLEDRLKSFWNIIFKVFMDVNWGLISAHMHPGQMCIVGPVTPAPGVPTPSPITPSMNRVGSDNLKGGTINPIGS